MKIKEIVKKSIPSFSLNAYRKFKLYEWRIGILESEVKNQWLIQNAEDVKDQKENIRRHEFKIYSQTGEDGIINYIFKKIGAKNKKFVEIGIEDGRECNTANLSLNFCWSGLLIEGNKTYAKKAQQYYKNKPVKVVNAFVTKENINNILKENNMKGEIDLLSIDIDGNDYWIWKEINEVKPRVVVVEYNDILGKEPITVKYDSNFERLRKHSSGFYYGASLSALANLAKSKGYILIGCNSFSFNAFFIKKNEAKKYFYHLSPEEADTLFLGEQELKKRFEKIKHLEFEKVV